MKPNRLFCVDLLRGFDIFYLLGIWYGLLVNGVFAVWPLTNPSARVFLCHELTAFAAPGRVPTGFGLLDFTQPLFIFVTGVSASLAMRKFVTAAGVDVKAFGLRLFKRTLMLWACGSLIRGLLEFKLFTGSAANPSFCFYSDTLHTIAIAYLAASLGLLLRRTWARLALGLLLLAIPAVILATCGDYSQHGNAARLIEEWVYTRLGGRAKDFCYLLTTFTWSGMGLLASLAGDVLKSAREPWMKARLLAVAGLATFVIGAILAIWIPPIRFIYTVSFVFETLGLSTLLLATLYVVTDIWKCRRGTWLLILFGQCSLAAWMMQNFFGDALGAAAGRIVDGLPQLLGSTTYQPIFRKIVRTAIFIWAVWTWRRLRDVRRVS